MSEDKNPTFVVLSPGEQPDGDFVIKETIERAFEEWARGMTRQDPIPVLNREGAIIGTATLVAREEVEPEADLDDMRDAEELLSGGLLFEVNRRVLHPLGLALAVETRGGRAVRISPRLVPLLRDLRDALAAIAAEDDLEVGR